MTQALVVRPISAAQHLEFVQAAPSASFLQTPAWALVKPEWWAESVGWFEQSRLVGVGLVLYRQMPKLKRYLAYLPEGPVIDYASDDLDRWLTPLGEHAKRSGAFGLRIGPPVVTARWNAEAIKQGVADPEIDRLTELAPTSRSPVGARVIGQLQELGWLSQAVAGGFAAGQPQFNFQLPLTHPDGSAKSESEVLSGMNQLWRRNIKKAEKAGVEVSLGSAADLPAFHELYVHTAQRDHFTPRPLSYFEVMFAALQAEDPDRIRLYLARHEDDLIASTIWICVGAHSWYSYGASSTIKRDVRGSNAIQWQMMRDSLAVGAEIYDLRGITETLASDDPHLGLIQFKVGTGGEAVEYVGEWDLPLRKSLYRAFTYYMNRR